MNIYIWEGDGVLTDYTDGLIVAVASSLEEAYEMIERADGVACYRGKSKGSFGTVEKQTVEEWSLNFPPQPTNIIPLDKAKPFAVTCWGGS